MKWLKKHWWSIPLGIFLLSTLSATVILVRAKDKKPLLKVVQCEGEEANNYKCWQQRYQAMINNQSPKEAFTDVRQAYETYPYVKSNCHQIAHAIGRAAAKKYVDVVETYNQGDNFCWSGYYHGVMEAVAAKLGAEQVIAQAPTICEGAKAKEAYSFYHYNCVHGLGHGIMAVNDNELFESLKICDKFTDNWEQQSCYSGAYMENVMSEFNPDHKTKYLKQDEPLYPCTAVEEKYKEQCYLMQTSHALTLVNQDYDKIFSLCSQVSSPYDATCYQSLGRDVSGNSSSDQNRTIELCDRGPNDSARNNCYVGAVKDFISYHHSDKEGLTMCAAISNPDTRNICTNTANEYYKVF